MGLQRNTKDKYGNAQPEQYVRIASINVDFRSERVIVELEHYANQAARVSNLPCINSSVVFMGEDFKGKFGEDHLKPANKTITKEAYAAVVEKYEADGETITNVDPDPEPEPDPEPVVKNLSRSSKRR